MEQQKVKLSVLNKFLICIVCNGYFRFAHTLSECGHTFCFICISNKTQCPKCQKQILKSQLRKDPYLQSIVDMLFPQFQKEDKQILEKLKQLFGDKIDDKDLQNLLVENNWEYKKKKKSLKEQQKQGLMLLVQETFGGYVTYEQFKDNIYNDQKFKEYLEYVQTKNKQINIKKVVPHQNNQQQTTKYGINLLGKYELDNQIAKLNLKISLDSKISQQNEMPLIKRIRRVVYKAAQKEQQKTQNNLIDITKANAENIKLYFNGRELNDNDDPDSLFQSVSEISISYEILFKL